MGEVRLTEDDRAAATAAEVGVFVGLGNVEWLAKLIVYLLPRVRSRDRSSERMPV